MGAPPYADGDLAGAWYAIVATDDPEANAAASAEAEERRVWCVRSDDAGAATAWTPAVGRSDGVTVAVLTGDDPSRSAAVRDAVVEGLRDGTLAAPRHRARTAGVALVGGGPGDPDLITVRGRRLLAEADVVVADRLGPRDLLDELPPHVEVIDAAKIPYGRAMAQEAINDALVAARQGGPGRGAAQGRRPVRLRARHGGGARRWPRPASRARSCPASPARSACRASPGSRSPIAGVAHEFTVVSGHVAPDDPRSLVDWAALARLRGTLVLLMAVEQLGAIAAALVAHGRDPGTPVAVVQEGTTAAQRRVDATLATLGARSRRARASARRPSSSSATWWPSARDDRGGTAPVADPITVDDPDDPRLRDYTGLTDVELRRRREPAEGLFIAEGEKVIRRALARRLPDALDAAVGQVGRRQCATSSTRPPHRSTRSAPTSPSRSPATTCTAARSPRCGRKPLPAAGELLATARRVVVMEAVNDHTNIGAIFRSAAALGMDAVLLSPDCADPLYRRSVKVSMGAVFSVPYARLASWPAGLATVRDAGFRLLALTPDPAAASLDDVAAHRLDRVALLLGAEGDGLTRPRPAPPPTSPSASRWPTASTPSTSAPRQRSPSTRSRPAVPGFSACPVDQGCAPIG